MTAITNYFIREPIEIYETKALECLTAHQLNDFRRCPLLYYKKKLGLIPEEERPAYLIGRALHTLVLEGRNAFNEQYAIGGPINPKTGEVYGANTKAFAEWAAEQGKPVLTTQQHELIARMAKAIEEHAQAKTLLSVGLAEGVLRTRYCDLRVQIRVDWITLDGRLVELKTCDDLDYFESDARRYGYVYQVAFYRSVIAQLTNEWVQAYFIAVEKKEPFRCGVWQIDPVVLQQAQYENEQAIAQLKVCLGRNEWPTRYETIRIFDRL